MGHKKILSILVASILLSSTSLMALGTVPNAYAGGGGTFFGSGLPVCDTNPITSELIDKINAMTWWAAEGVFLIDLDGELYELTTTGVLTFIGELDSDLKGLAFNLAGDTLYGVERSSDTLYTIDPTDASFTDDISINFDDSNGNPHGLATDPTTGILYAVLLGDDNERFLVILDPLTGDTTTIGVLPPSFGSIAFSSDGTLNGSTGFNSGITKSFFKIDKTDASVDFVCHYGGPNNAEDGQALAYNPVDGLFYQYMAGSILQWNGQSTLLPCDTTDIPAMGEESYDNARGLVYWAAENVFLDSSGSDLNSITTDGTITDIGNMGFTSRGMAFNLAEDTLYVVASGDTALYTIDPTDASTVDSVEIVLAGIEDFDGGHGLATDPTTGTLYALLRDVDRDDEGELHNHILVTIVPGTGTATEIALLGDSIAGITFNSAGELFGVTGDGAGNGNVYWSIDKTTGVLTSICALGNGFSGESLAFNSDDGAFYHRSGGIFEKINGIGSFPPPPSGLVLYSIDRFLPILFSIDPLTGQITGFALINSEFSVNGGTALADNPGNTLYAVLAVNGGFDPTERRLAVVNPTSGDTTDIGDLDAEVNGIAFKDGTLFGVTGRTQFSEQPKLNTISTSDATVTTLCELPDNGSPELAFNPTDGFLYYGSGGEIGRILDTDPDPFSETEDCELDEPFGFFGFIPELVSYLIQSIIPQAEAGGFGFNDNCNTRSLTWSPFQDLFLCGGGGSLVSVDTTDPNDPIEEFIGFMGHESHGLAFSFVNTAVGGTSIPIDTTSLIVAGSQMTMSWLIPVLVAGAGIVFVIARRK